MPRDAAFKRRVRREMARTGLRYTEARARVRAEDDQRRACEALGVSWDVALAAMTEVMTLAVRD